MVIGYIESSNKIKPPVKFKKIIRKNIKIIIILLVVFIFFILFLIISHLVNERERHNDEINHIIELERRAEERQKEIENARIKSTICMVAQYDNPRDCYFGSSYKCHWDEKADRCNLIK